MEKNKEPNIEKFKKVIAKKVFTKKILHDMYDAITNELEKREFLE